MIGFVYKNKKEGLFQKYYNNGILQEEAYFINDKIIGHTKFWYNNGNIKKIYYLYLYVKCHSMKI